MKYQNLHLKLPFLQILKSLQNAWACLPNVICHFDEIIIISTKLQKLKTVFVNITETSPYKRDPDFHLTYSKMGKSGVGIKMIKNEKFRYSSIKSYVVDVV